MRLIKSFLILSFLCQASLAWAGEKSHSQLVDELMVKSGAQRQLAQIPEVIKATVDQKMEQDTKMSAEDKLIFKDVMSGAFDAATMTKFVKDYASAGLTDDQLNNVLLWLNSPLGKKITRLEEAASSAAAYKEMNAFARELQTKKPDEKRVASLEQFDRASHMTESSVQIKIDVAVAMAGSVACAIQCDESTVEQTAAQMEKNRPQFEESSKQEFLVASLYTYKSLTDAELEKYTAFYSTEAGQKYMKVFTDSLSEAIKDASRKLGKKLGVALKQKKEKLPPKGTDS